MTKQEEIKLCGKFIENIKADNKPAALENLSKVIESKIKNKIQEKKQNILASKKF